MHKKLVMCLAIALLMLSGCSPYINKKVDTSKNTNNNSTYAFKTSSPINITIIGDSVAKGTGDEKGSGFSTYLPEYLKEKTDGNISIFNGGVDGLKSSGLVESLKNAELGKRVTNSDLIVISIGGNDVLGLNSVADNKKLGALKSTEDEYLNNLKNILTVIRQ